MWALSCYSLNINGIPDSCIQCSQSCSFTDVSSFSTCMADQHVINLYTLKSYYLVTGVSFCVLVLSDNSLCSSYFRTWKSPSRKTKSWIFTGVSSLCLEEICANIDRLMSALIIWNRLKHRRPSLTRAEQWWNENWWVDKWGQEKGNTLLVTLSLGTWCTLHHLCIHFTGKLFICLLICCKTRA